MPTTRRRRIVRRAVMALAVAGVVLMVMVLVGLRWVSPSLPVQSDEPIPFHPEPASSAGRDVMSTDQPIEEWDDPKFPVVITTQAVAEGRRPILRVVHEGGHGGWQFYDDAEPLAEPVVLPKDMILEIEPTVAGLKERLPIGWQAIRESQDADWEMMAVHASE